MTLKEGEADFVWTTPAFSGAQIHFQTEQIIPGGFIQYGGDGCKLLIDKDLCKSYLLSVT
jgi:hypothetical protein